MRRTGHRGVQKRKFFRLEIPLQVKVTIITEDKVPGGQTSIIVKSRNISEEGICIETRQVEIDGVHMLSGSPGAQKNRLDLELDLYGTEKTLKIIGEVCWYDLAPESENFMFQVGIVFLNIDAEKKSQLKSFLKNQRPRKGGFLRRFFNILYESRAVILRARKAQ